MKRRTFLIILAILHFSCAILSGAISWPAQTVVVSVSGIITAWYLGHYCPGRLGLFLIVLLPFYLLYIPLSVNGGSPLTYPIWITGALVTGLTYWATRRAGRIYLAISGLVLFVALVRFAGLPNYYAAVWQEADPARYDLRLAAILDAGKKEVDFENFRGKTVLVDVWSTSCGSCIEAFPELQALYDRYRDDSLVEIISLNIPGKTDVKFPPTRFTDPFTFPKMYFKTSDESDKLGIQGIPLVLIFDKQLNCRYAGSLTTDWYVWVGNANRIIRQLKREL